MRIKRKRLPFALGSVGTCCLQVNAVRCLRSNLEQANLEGTIEKKALVIRIRLAMEVLRRSARFVPEVNAGQEFLYMVISSSTQWNPRARVFT